MKGVFTSIGDKIEVYIENICEDNYHLINNIIETILFLNSSGFLYK